MQVPLQPDVSGSPVSTPTRQGLGSPISFLSRALSSINPLRRGPEDRTPRASAPPTPQGLSINLDLHALPPVCIALSSVSG